MEQSTRFELRLSAKRRRQLDDLARELGMSSSDLARLGVFWVIENPSLLLTGRPAARELAGESKEAA